MANRRSHSSYTKTVFRSIKGSLARFLAILAIIMLGVGFYSGLVLTTPSFYKTAQKYIDDQNLYDFKLISTVGFDDTDIGKLEELDGVKKAVGASYADAIGEVPEFSEKESSRVIRFHTLTEGVNDIKLIKGRLPEKGNEILLDEYRCKEEYIGKKLYITSANSDKTLSEFSYDEYEIVGIVRSPIYMNFQRGTTEVGGGEIHYFAYLPKDGLTYDYYTEAYIVFEDQPEAYTDEYEDFAKSKTSYLETELMRISNERVERLLGLGGSSSEDPFSGDPSYAVYAPVINGMKDKITFAFGMLFRVIMTLDGVDISSPEVYVLGRDLNTGYVSFDNDAVIVEGIANVFPLFLFALAALVCSTTMQRMVMDERGQIGVMRALGYSEFAITMKYVIYSGLASVTGCIIGFLIGIRLFPYVIWEVYGMMYGFAPIEFESSIPVFILALSVSLLCSVGVTVITCITELRGTPADLIRPKAPPAGKRILLERMGFIWKKLRFTYKVSLRNVFRFKKRMWMMVIGIAGSTALLITGFGLNDSITDIVDIQFDDIFLYDMVISYKDGTSMSDIADTKSVVESEYSEEMTGCYAYYTSLVHNGKDAIRDVYLFVSDDPDITSVVRGISDGKLMPWPGDGEIAISDRLAEKNGIKAGDEITFQFGDQGRNFTVKVGYVFENHIYHYAFMNARTYEEIFGGKYEPNALLIKRQNGEESPYSDFDVAGAFGKFDCVKARTVTQYLRNNFRETMKQLSQVVILIIGCAAALAFVVLFNLNNINITERIREIATIKVLGFNRMETGSYVFRENVLLVLMGFVFGIPLGIALHKFVIDHIEMDTGTFVVQIFPQSYLYSLGFIILFSVIVDLVMRAKMEKIDMAESLKSIE